MSSSETVDRRDVAGRYLLRQRTSTGGELHTYRGWDATLERRVRISLLDATDSRGPELLDAARRVAVLEDARVPRILDAGTDHAAGPALTPGPSAGAPTGRHTLATGEHPDFPDGVAYVVEEEVEGRTLTDLLRSGPLLGPAARALVGEVATALDAAARRGLHHTRLTPDHVVLGPDGLVHVLGIGVESALAPEPPSVSTGRADAIANRADAVGCVALLYAALTGRWPTVDSLAPHPGLPSAPSGADGRPLPPKEIRPEVPNDLDTLASVTFGPHADGPHTPAELALQLAPWSMDVWYDVLREMRGERAAREVRDRLGGEAVPEAEPVIPFVAPTPTRTRREDSRFVLVLVAAVVLVGLVLAVWQLSRIATPDLGDDAAPARPAATSTAPSPAATPETTPEATPSVSAGPLPVTGITTIDPQGDGESPAGAAAMTDGDPASTWQSQRYSTTAFGGLKNGIGIVVDLGAEVDVTSVQLTQPGSGGRVELRTSVAPEAPTGPEGTTVVGEAAAGGDATITPAAPVRARWLLLWSTELPTNDGAARWVVGQVAVTGTAG
ncbi:hypothetical protein ACFFKU_01555 [Kineococcus gynurae]|uniref:Protein kinase domain-containing protein n=1 Tax=Kineococcus gynurae TaxID=452979 RepID=A0ABV5LT30_9ACTN